MCYDTYVMYRSFCLESVNVEGTPDTILLHEGYYSIQVEMEFQWKKTDFHTQKITPEPWYGL